MRRAVVVLAGVFASGCGGGGVPASEVQPEDAAVLDVAYDGDASGEDADVACTPSCVGRSCGDDGCGGTCGECSTGYACSPDGDCVANCVSLCLGIECGLRGAQNECDCGSCADGDACNGVETCSSAGTCVAEQPPVCADANPCTDDACDSATGCVFPANHTACEDDDVCTVGDVCSGGVCTPGITELGCNDGIALTADACISKVGCEHTPVVWDPDAGLVVPLTAGAVVSVTSSPNESLNVIDGDTNTQWQSGGCLPTGFMSRADMNVALGRCAQGGCSGSTAADLSGATDASPYTGASLPVSGTEAWFEVSLPSAQGVHAISVRGVTTTSITLSAITPNGPVNLGQLTPADNYKYVRFLAPAATVSAVRAVSDASFTMTELAIQGTPCFEAVTVDLGAVKEVGWIRTKHFAGGHALTTTLSSSADGTVWQTLAALDPAATALVDTVLASPVGARYLRVRHEMDDVDWAKAFVFELVAYDGNGPFGPMPQAKPQKRSMAELIGVNGIWGWGTGGYSNAADATRGPALFSRVAASGRNYHNMAWDVTDPDHVPAYETMAFGGGTEAMWWLDWDQEYAAWEAAGVPVQASIQFLNSGFAQGVWDDPYMAAYTYGYQFAKHFGPTAGTGHVQAMEVGNEPWDYPASFYTEVLRGMASGAKSGDPAMLVMPGAFQADTPEKPAATGGNYLGARVLEEDAPYLDVLNFHTYSYRHESDGTRVGVHPEHKESTLHTARNMIRFRNHNLPGAPIYVTEWGWDSDGAGESCAATECVSEAAQAVYGVRGAFLFARLGVDKLHWFFYGNSTNCDTLYCRSGLTGSSTASFALKRSFRAFEGMLSILGGAHFRSVLREDPVAWIYAFSDAAGVLTHLAAWRPVDAADTLPVTVTQVVAGIPGQAWALSGQTSTGEAVAAPTVDGGQWTLEISAVPMVVDIVAFPPN